MKLELKHLAPHLPHKLKAETKGQIREVVADFVEFHDINDHVSLNTVMLKGYKPILRPLSDLTKEIEIDGCKFIPVELIQDEYGIKLEYDVDCGVWYPTERGRSENLFLSVYPIQEKFFEWHFDVFGLIENNLAIDINTL